MGIFTPEGFKAYELVDEATYTMLGDESWRLLDIKLLITLDTIKTLKSWSIVVNDWHWGKSFQYRGVRTHNCKIGADGSAHRKGMAVDFDAYEGKVRISPTEVREVILRNIDDLPHLRCIETENWNHIDVMDEKDSSSRTGINEKNILFYSPIHGSRIVKRKDIESEVGTCS